MASLWLPGAIVVKGNKDGGSMVGGPARFTWHTYESDPKGLTAKRGAERLAAAGNDLHFVLNPLSGEIAQMIPANRAGRGLKNAPGGVETNRMGKVNLQCEVIAYAATPFTSYITPAGKEAVRKLIAWAEEWGVPSVWPDGAPVDYKASYPASHYPRSVSNWTSKAGHYSHSQVPENYHGDPGAIDISLWKPVAPAPRPTGPVVSRDTNRRPIIKRYLRITKPLTSGPDVLEVAKALKLVRPAATGTAIYGPKMAAAVEAFQRREHLTVDGVVGPQVCKAMNFVFIKP